MLNRARNLPGRPLGMSRERRHAVGCFARRKAQGRRLFRCRDGGALGRSLNARPVTDVVLALVDLFDERITDGGGIELAAGEEGHSDPLRAGDLPRGGLGDSLQQVLVIRLALELHRELAQRRGQAVRKVPSAHAR